MFATAAPYGCTNGVCTLNNPQALTGTATACGEPATTAAAAREFQR